MYKNQRVAVVIPAYNEEKLISKTINTVPDFVDYIIAVNDGSKDNTLTELKNIRKNNKKIVICDNKINLGVGASVVYGFKQALNLDTDIIGVMAGDAQCDPDFIKPMLEVLTKSESDYIKANRFYHRDALKSMPIFRQVGNIFISLLTKFSTGYYSISDSQNGFGFFRRNILERISLDMIGKRYDYENTLLVALSIAGAKIKDHPVPAIYGDEVSSIKFLPTALRALRAIWIGFWRRIYYKYVLYSFHPIALFLISGFILTLFGFIFGIYISYRRFFEDFSPSTGTVMLIVLPLFLGFQFTLTAVTMDMNNEGRD